VCGDGACNPREDCHTCVADCGECLPCAHDLCETGDGLDSACDPCAGEVCGIDSYCCASSWDTTCVIEVSTVCAQSCTPGLTIYLTIPRSTYAEGTIVPITATVLDAEAPVSRARVRFTLTRPDGHRVRKDLTTGSSGQVTWRYSAGRRARGGHAVSARVSFGGASANSATITFTVP
jgi:hypothetical protein